MLLSTVLGAVNRYNTRCPSQLRRFYLTFQYKSLDPIQKYFSAVTSWKLIVKANCMYKVIEKRLMKFPWYLLDTSWPFFFSPVHYFFFYNSARAGLPLYTCSCMQTHTCTHTGTNTHTSSSHLVRPFPLLYLFFLLIQSQFPLCNVFRPCLPCWCFIATSSHSPCVMF